MKQDETRLSIAPIAIGEAVTHAKKRKAKQGETKRPIFALKVKQFEKKIRD